ncbi:hypothetical protein PSTG_17160 [Puccinia striiformis f. sp. tritici PST-78]|uniref:HAT C-terminal dimerisation domain-containing protein n=1 Tax=Puccinia striiformis f. sp. tritici PST-78 TaxID=1165861 RepID=A0A0L0UQQ9_9BASI|nr:hypothetical protein PSTG_17160 [Puccinia striiformis f. sp. tritici PST-78]
MMKIQMMNHMLSMLTPQPPEAHKRQSTRRPQTNKSSVSPGGLSLNDQGGPGNPLKWWMRQRRAGNTHGGLLQMALDVLSCPATTVDVERPLSFGRDYVSLQRHRLSATSVTRGMAVAFYAKNGKIKTGVLRKWKLDKKNEAKRKGKGKATRN